jgi:hypothetical protein
MKHISIRTSRAPGLVSSPILAAGVIALVMALGGVAYATLPASKGVLPLRSGSLGGARPAAAGGVVVVRAAGDIRAEVDRYRNLLGPDNGGAPGGHAQGRREINWDSVPDRFAEPNALPGDFFNASTAPRARGALLTTPGKHVAVSAGPHNPYRAAVRFGDINPTYPGLFRTFSPPRLFSPIGSNIVNLYFRVPGTDRPGLVRGFGAVYTNVTIPEKTGFRYYDSHGRLLGAFTVPVKPRGLSFLGVLFPAAVVARVRIEYGNHALGPNESTHINVAVMDNFIYGEPQP